MPGDIHFAYPVDWILAEKFSQITGYSVEAVRIKRKRGLWPDGTITKVQNGRIHVNLKAYDQWVENGISSLVK